MHIIPYIKLEGRLKIQTLKENHPVIGRVIATAKYISPTTAWAQQSITHDLGARDATEKDQYSINCTTVSNPD